MLFFLEVINFVLKMHKAFGKIWLVESTKCHERVQTFERWFLAAGAKSPEEKMTLAHSTQTDRQAHTPAHTEKERTK